MSDASGPGERLEQVRRRRRHQIIGGSFVIGMVVGVIVGLREGADFFEAQFDWSPALALGIAFSYVAAVVGGGWALSRQIDEFERQAQYKAVAVAAFFYAVTYPVWLVLWFGGLAPEPQHALLFIGFWLSLLAASLYYRFR